MGSLFTTSCLPDGFGSLTSFSGVGLRVHLKPCRLLRGHDTGVEKPVSLIQEQSCSSAWCPFSNARPYEESQPLESHERTPQLMEAILHQIGGPRNDCPSQDLLRISKVQD